MAYEKQKSASQWEYQHISVPQIFDVVQDEGHVSVKMEYVYSRNFIEYFEAAGFEQVDYFIKALVLFVEKELKESPILRVPTSLTFDKFEDVRNKICSNPFLTKDAEVTSLMQDSEQRFLLFVQQDSIEIPVGVCHGDLTFSNILFNGNNYYLIDFLDSFIESPLLDIVKIRQDSTHLWSQLMYTKQYDKLRLRIICEKIDREIDQYFRKYEWYRRYYDIYSLMNLLRILQYAKEEKVVKYLKRCISDVLEGSVTSSGAHIAPVATDCCDEGFSLIVPVAADNGDGPMPYVFSLDEKGIMLCVKAIQGLNLDVFDHIYFTILRKHAELFNVDEMMRLQFRRLNLKNADLVVLNEPTACQTETIWQTIKNRQILGGIFIKDADGYFELEVRKENAISVFPLEEMSVVDPQHKSYVADDNMRYITNIIERRVIGHLFNAGGYCFENVNEFVSYYIPHMREGQVNISHIVYEMLLNSEHFVPLQVKGYKDFTL